MDTVKLVDVEKGLIEGWAIPFGGPMPGNKDLDGDAFSKDTELYLDAYDKRPVLYFHGMDKALGAGPIGTEVKWEQRDGGIWLEAQIATSAKYQEHIRELAKRGLLGYSSGANPRSVVKSASGLIERWMWMETSLLPIPSNPFGMVTMKALGFKEMMPVSDQVQLCEMLGHFPDTGEVAVWMAEKAQKDDKPDAALGLRRPARLAAAQVVVKVLSRVQERRFARLPRALGMGRLCSPSYRSLGDSCCHYRVERLRGLRDRCRAQGRAVVGKSGNSSLHGNRGGCYAG